MGLNKIAMISRASAVEERKKENLLRRVKKIVVFFSPYCLPFDEKIGGAGVIVILASTFPFWRQSVLLVLWSQPVAVFIFPFPYTDRQRLEYKCLFLAWVCFCNRWFILLWFLIKKRCAGSVCVCVRERERE